MSSQLFSLQGKIALVTGGTRGIGAAMAIGLAEAGADVVIVQRDTSNTRVITAIEKVGRKAYGVQVDLSQRDQVKGLLPKVLEIVPHIDILVNCAGINKRHKILEFPDKDWDDIIQVNLSCTFTLSREMANYFLTKQLDDHGVRGKIINIGSLASFQGGINISAYAASKGGVAQLTRSFSNELISKGIFVNSIAPGYVTTDMTQGLTSDKERNAQITERIPAGRWAVPEDFKGPVVFLASNASNYVSGEVLLVDGGWMAN